MGRTVLIAAASITIALTGCGGGSSDVTFPPLGAEQDGYPSVDVADQAEADKLCDAAGEEWPGAWAEADEAVTLDIPDSDSDTICVRP